MTVPEGWTTSSTSMSTRFGRPGDLRRVSCGDLPRDFPGDQAYDADCARFGFEVINDPQDPCVEPIGSTHSTFDDLVTDVARHLGRKTTTADVTIGGYRAKHLANSSVADAAFYCHASPYEEVWIVDVDGMVLMIGSHPDGDLPLNVPRKALKAEIRQMVESIRFER